jgi:predicted pyridoxine 5'-phosphate oxidase superfamily flavin-nucleotide-binding protein
MFMIPKSNTVVRVNGTAQLTDDAELRRRFEHKSRLPATVIVIKIAEIYTQCARALMRADTWNRDDSADLPTAGEILAEMTDGAEGGAKYDAEWAPRAAKTMW